MLGDRGSDWAAVACMCPLLVGNTLFGTPASLMVGLVGSILKLSPITSISGLRVSPSRPNRYSQQHRLNSY